MRLDQAVEGRYHRVRVISQHSHNATPRRPVHLHSTIVDATASAPALADLGILDYPAGEEPPELQEAADDIVRSATLWHNEHTLN